MRKKEVIERATRILDDLDDHVYNKKFVCVHNTKLRILSLINQIKEFDNSNDSVRIEFYSHGLTNQFKCEEFEISKQCDRILIDSTKVMGSHSKDNCVWGFANNSQVSSKKIGESESNIQG